MKANHLMLLVFLLSLISVTDLSANNVPNEKRLETIIREKLLTSTAILGNIDNRSVTVTFSINEEGKINVLSSTGTDEDINMYVIHKLEGLRVYRGFYTPGKTYGYKLIFKKN